MRIIDKHGPVTESPGRGARTHPGATGLWSAWGGLSGAPQIVVPTLCPKVFKTYCTHNKNRACATHKIHHPLEKNSTFGRVFVHRRPKKMNCFKKIKPMNFFL